MSDDTIFKTAMVPIDRTAALVTSKGFEYTPAKKILREHSPFPFPTRLPDKNLTNSPTFTNLTKVQFGHFTVIGLDENSRKWVVRCKCGNYEMRTAKAIKNPENWGDRCSICQHDVHLKRQAEYKEKGFNTKDTRSLI